MLCFGSFYRTYSTLVCYDDSLIIFNSIISGIVSLYRQKVLLINLNYLNLKESLLL